MSSERPEFEAIWQDDSRKLHSALFAAACRLSPDFARGLCDSFEVSTSSVHRDTQVEHMATFKATHTLWTRDNHASFSLTNVVEHPCTVYDLPTDIRNDVLRNRDRTGEVGGASLAHLDVLCVSDLYGEASHGVFSQKIYCVDDRAFPVGEGGSDDLSPIPVDQRFEQAERFAKVLHALRI